MDGQCTITINGKEVGLKFNRYGIEQANAIKGSINSTYKQVISWVWGGIHGFAFAKQTEADITFEDVIDWIEELEVTGELAKELEKITAAYQSSILYKGLVSKNEEQEQIKVDEQIDEEKKSNSLTSSDSFLRAS